MGIEHHHPILSTLGIYGGRPKIDINLENDRTSPLPYMPTPMKKRSRTKKAHNKKIVDTPQEALVAMKEITQKG